MHYENAIYFINLVCMPSVKYIFCIIFIQKYIHPYILCRSRKHIKLYCELRRNFGIYGFWSICRNDSKFHLISENMGTGKFRTAFILSRMSILSNVWNCTNPCQRQFSYRDASEICSINPTFLSKLSSCWYVPLKFCVSFVFLCDK